MSMKKRPGGKRLAVLIFLLAIIFLFTAGKLFLDAIYVPVILMYHSVDRGGLELKNYGGKLNVYPEAFAKQMKFLHEHNYKVIPLAEFIERIKRGEKIPPKTVAITFDDGLKNNFLYAYPVLKKYNFPATIFVPTDFVGKKNFVTWQDIKTMQENNISIEGHTMSQAWLPALDEEGIRRELSGSKRAIEEMTGRPVRVLSYHMGAFDSRVKDIAKELGYIGAVATNPGRKYPNDDPYALKRQRISMTSDNPIVFRIQTSGYHTFIKEVRDDD